MMRGVHRLRSSAVRWFGVLAWTGIFGFGFFEGARAEPATSEAHVRASESPDSLLGDYQLAPMVGTMVVDGSAAFAVGGRFGYQILEAAPLFFEPGLSLGFFSGVTRFQLEAGLRFDVPLHQTDWRLFFRAAGGPTFQTEGDVAVLGAYAGAGTFVPLTQTIEGRVEMGMVSMDGNTGLQVMAGLAL